jgi:uncharacterized protein
VQNHPANVPSQPDSTMQNKTGRVAFLQRLMDRHPYLGALLLLVYWLLLLFGLGRLLAWVLAITHIHLPYLQYILAGELLAALIVVLPLSLLGWWFEAGFTRGINGQGVAICWIPIVFVVGPTLLGLPVLVSEVSGSLLVTAVMLSLLVGFAEEGMFRGLIVRSLLPRGIWPSVLFSALFFACAHLTNLIGGFSWGYVSVQVLLAFGMGILFAAIRLRTGSIWPGLLLHAGHDFGGLLLLGGNPAIARAPLSNASIITNSVFCLIFLLNALFLLRRSQVKKMEVAYGLAPEPVDPLLFNQE